MPAGAPAVRLRDLSDRVRRLVLPRQGRSRRQQRVGFVSSLDGGEGVWPALSVERRQLRRESRVQRDHPLRLEAILVELCADFVSCRIRRPRGRPYQRRPTEPARARAFSARATA